MKLHEILKDSNYSLDLFSKESIANLENKIIEKFDKKGNRTYYVNCLIRNKET